MKKAVFIGIGILILLAGSAALTAANRKSRNEMYLRMTELAAETLAAVPTDTPVPSATPTDIPEPTAVPLRYGWTR